MKTLLLRVIRFRVELLMLLQSIGVVRTGAICVKSSQRSALPKSGTALDSTSLLLQAQPHSEECSDAWVALHPYGSIRTVAVERLLRLQSIRQ